MIAELVIGIALPIIQKAGYLGILLLMLAESTLLPVPSEAVMPFAGYLVAQGTLDFWITLIAATIGTILGALISYFIGKYIGHAVVKKWGKYFFVGETEMEHANTWFKKHGEGAIFICRFIPAIRHVISIPAGAAEMNIKKFILYTAAGGAIWNGILLIIGMQLKQNWGTILSYSTIIDAAVILAVIIGIIWFIYTHAKRNKPSARKRPVKKK